jgi:hypothetical protein
MGKRTSQHASPAVLGLSLLDAIARGELDDRLTALAEAIDARRRLLHTVRSATVLAGLRVGDLVRINHAISPRYLAGLQATVVELDDHAATLRLQRPVGRFSTGVLRCPPLALDRLEAAVADQAATGPSQMSSSSEP